METTTGFGEWDGERTSGVMGGSRRALGALLLLAASLPFGGCASALGQVRGDPVVDLMAMGDAPQDCQVTFLERRDPRLEALDTIGELTLEGGSWMVREDMEELARARACRHGATHVSLSRERYGAAVLGSSARARLLVERSEVAPVDDG